MLGNYQVAIQLVASRVVLSFIELVSYYRDNDYKMTAYIILQDSV
jgi:hypothetical protein